MTQCVFRTAKVPLLEPQEMIDCRKYGRQVEASHATEYLDFIVEVLLFIHSTCLFDFPFSKLFVPDVF